MKYFAKKEVVVPLKAESEADARAELDVMRRDAWHCGERNVAFTLMYEDQVSEHSDPV